MSSSNKTPTEVPNVFSISMGNGQKRLWCGACKKFLATNGGGFHDCDPNWRQRLSAGKTTSQSSGSKRRWRMTPARMTKLFAIIDKAAKYEALRSELKKMAEKKPKWAGVKKMSGDLPKKKATSMKRSLGFK